jgi:hypothetical protein
MRGQNGSSEDETEDMIEVDEGAPAAPQPRRTEISAQSIADGILDGWRVGPRMVFRFFLATETI